MIMSTQRKMLVTSALPYANGSLHLGHMLEHIQSDIWVRFQRLSGNDCTYICGDDAHGTPIMILAKKQNKTPEELIATIHKEHAQDFKDFNVNYDNFYTTHSDENKFYSEKIYHQLLENGDIETRTIYQCYDEKENMFLPDRLVKGECPRCGAKDQYGDNCEVCGATYSPDELKNPISTLSNTPPVKKESLHYFFKLENYTDMLKKWIQNERLQKSVINKLLEWFNLGLRPWDISRDAPYFGFKIPNTDNKYFYVWLDAPIGYMASFKNLCSQRSDLDFDEYWNKNSPVELYHFIGKDIIYFHALFWPAMLYGSGYRQPTGVFAHGYLTINSSKMSKSRGTLISARHYLNYLNPDYLRYYFAAKLGSTVDDIDLSLEDFMQRVNSDLVGKFVNIASRCAGFITKKSDGMLAEKLENQKLFDDFTAKNEVISALFESREYNQAVREIMALADIANQYIAEKAPWSLAKQEGKELEVQLVCTQALNLFKILMYYLAPITPSLIENAKTFLNIETLDLNSLLKHKINEFRPLLQRIEQEQIDNLIANETV